MVHKKKNHCGLKVRVEPSKNSEPFRLLDNGTKPFAPAVAMSLPIRLDTGNAAICAGLVGRQQMALMCV